MYASTNILCFLSFAFCTGFTDTEEDLVLTQGDTHNMILLKTLHQKKTNSNKKNLFSGLGTVSVNIRVLDFSHNNITYIAPYYFR